MKSYLEVFRVKQWVKNLFIFIPAFFAGNFFDTDRILSLALAFASFCLVASTVYIFNDIRDMDADRIHPRKKYRPFASGWIKPGQGYILMTILFLISFGLAYHLSIDFLLLCLLYLSLNLGYSLGLKTIAILDLLIVSSGFIIRVYMGGVIAQVPISHWLSIMIFLLSLFLILAKRRDDIRIYEEEGTIVRKSSMMYNMDYINSCITMVSGIIIVSYILYCVSPEITAQWGSEYVFLTTIFVIAGVMRYLQLTLVEQKSGSPVQILYTDKFTIVTIVLWVVSFGFIIYV